MQINNWTFRPVKEFGWAFFFVFISCSSGLNRETIDNERLAKEFSPGKNVAKLYVFRNQFAYKRQSDSLLLNSSPLGSLLDQSFYLLEVPAGAYELKSQAGAMIRLQLQTGKKYFVRQEIRMGLNGGISQLRLESEISARDNIRSAIMLKTISSVFEPL